MNKYSQNIIGSIKAIQHADKAQLLENYVKHNIKSYGVGIPEIREIIRNAEETNLISKQSIAEQSQFLDDLMKQEYTEPKLSKLIACLSLSPISSLSFKAFFKDFNAFSF